MYEAGKKGRFDLNVMQILTCLFCFILQKSTTTNILGKNISLRKQGFRITNINVALVLINEASSLNLYCRYHYAVVQIHM